MPDELDRWMALDPSCLCGDCLGCLAREQVALANAVEAFAEDEPDDEEA